MWYRCIFKRYSSWCDGDDDKQNSRQAPCKVEDGAMGRGRKEISGRSHLFDELFKGDGKMFDSGTEESSTDFSRYRGICAEVFKEICRMNGSCRLLRK